MRLLQVGGIRTDYEYPGIGPGNPLVAALSDLGTVSAETGKPFVVPATNTSVRAASEPDGDKLYNTG